jgi:hypothetical protein
VLVSIFFFFPCHIAWMDILAELCFGSNFQSFFSTLSAFDPGWCLYFGIYFWGIYTHVYFPPEFALEGRIAFYELISWANIIVKSLIYCVFNNPLIHSFLFTISVHTNRKRRKKSSRFSLTKGKREQYEVARIRTGMHQG